MFLSRREGVPPCLRTSPPLGGTLEVHRTSWRIPLPRHACMSWYWGSEALGCRTLRLESQSSAGLRMQPYTRSPDLIWPGHLHRRGCLSARAMDTGFPTVVWRLCLGPGCAWVWVSVTLPALAGVLGGCVWVRFVVSPLFSPLGFAVFAVVLGFRPVPLLSWLGVWDVRGCVRAPPAPRRSRFRCALWSCVLGSGLRLHPASPGGGVVGVCVRLSVCPACPRPSWGAACGAGVCWCCCWWGVPPPLPFGFSFSRFVVLVVGCPGLGSRGLCPPIPSLPGHIVCCLCFFFLPSVLCVRVFWVSLLPVGRCPRLGVAGFGWVVPRRPFGGSRLRCRLGRGFGRLLWCWWEAWWLWAVFAPPPSPFFFWGGLPVPPSAFPGLAHARFGILCGFPVCFWWLHFARPCPGPMGRVGYVHVGFGAPSCRGRLLALLGGRLSKAASCGSGLGGLGLSVSFRLRGARCNFLSGPPPLLPGSRLPLAGVWRAGAVPSGVCGGLFWLVLLVRVSRAVVCRSLPRRSALCCGVLCFGVPCRVALHCGALRCGVPCCLVLCRGGSVEVSLARVVVRSAGRSVAGWWLGAAVRCGWLAGSVLWGSGCAARAGGSGRCPWGCPPWAPVPWSRVLWRSRSLALGAVAVPSSSSGAREVALVVAGVVPWR